MKNTNQIIEQILEGNNIRKVILDEEWKDWKKATGVEVVLYGQPVKYFDTLEKAKEVFPDLDPEHNSKNFTWALHGHNDRIRFEDWKTNEMLSN